MSEDAISPTPDGPRVGRRQLRLGALGAALYALAAVIFLGPAIDESVVAAQIITGDIPYPAGHPHEVFYRQALSLPNQLTAVLYALTDAPLLVSAVRNWLALFLSLFVPFTAALLLTGRSFWGWLTMGMVLTGAPTMLAGKYPIFVFPDFYSHGHVGVHVAVIAVLLLLAHGRWFWTGLCYGTLPTVHPLLSVLAIGFGALFLWSEGNRLDGEARRYLAGGVIVGMTVSLLVAVRVMAFSSAGDPAFPYDIPASEAVRRNFFRFVDGHSVPFSWRSFGYLTNPTLYFSLLGLLLFGSRTAGVDASEQKLFRRACTWLAVFGALVFSLVYGAQIVFQSTGWLPGPLELAMTSRLSNATAVLVIPLLVSGFFMAAREASEVLGHPPWTLGVSLLLVVALAVLADHTAVQNNLVPGLLGTLTGMLVSSPRNRRVAWYAAAAAGTGLLLVPQEPAGARFALVFLLTSAGFHGLRSLSGGKSLLLRTGAVSQTSRVVLTCVALILIGAAVLPDGVVAGPNPGPPPPERISDFDRRAAEWVRSETDESEPILAPVHPRTELQAKLERPVLFELETIWLMTYMPDLSGVLGRMTRDLYGIDLSDEAFLRSKARDGYISITRPIWHRAWEERSSGEWYDLARTYDFAAVVAPRDVELDLTVAVEGRHWHLYGLDRQTAVGNGGEE